MTLGRVLATCCFCMVAIGLGCSSSSTGSFGGVQGSGQGAPVAGGNHGNSSASQGTSGSSGSISPVEDASGTTGTPTSAEDASGDDDSGSTAPPPGGGSEAGSSTVPTIPPFTLPDAATTSTSGDGGDSCTSKICIDPVFDCPLQGCFNGCTDFHCN